VLDAENGADGVKKATEQQPDLILMDIIMPDINGFQATRQLPRMRRPRIFRSLW